MDLIRAENETLPINERVVVKSNKIIEARYHLGLNEQRIIALLTLAIKPYSTEFETYRLNIKEFAETFSIPYTGDLIYRLYDALESLKNKKFTPYEDDLKRKFGKKSWSIIGWIDHAEYREGEATIDIKFNEKLKAYYLELQTDFTKLPSLQNAIRTFKCLYSYRLYELLESFSFKAKRDGTYERIFEYEELREKLGIRPDQYLKISHFKDRVIDPAIKELNKYTEIIVKKVKYDNLVGRSTSHINFLCYKSEQLTLPLAKNHDGIISVDKEKEDIFDMMIELGVTKVTAKRLCNNYNIEIIKRNIDYAMEMKEKGKVKASFQGYLVTAIAEDYGQSKPLENEKIKFLKEKTKQQLEEEVLQNKQDEEKKKHREALENEFNSLSEPEKEKIRLAFEDDLTEILSKLWSKAKLKNPKTPEEWISVKAVFFRFYEKTYQ